MNRIPLLVPKMPNADSLLPYLRQIDANQKYTNFGPLNAEFERRLIDDVATGLSTANVTTVSNCTVGLELTLQAHGLAPGANVLIPAITFVATATAAIRIGMVPVISDVDPANWLLTPALADVARRDRPIDLVMPVATFGCPHDTAEWDKFTARTGIPVVIDAAGAYGNQKIGATTDVVFSFHATKSFGAAEGGAVLSANAARIASVRKLANFGIDTSISQLTAFGTNGKMSEYHCALGLASFDEWERTKAERRTLSQRYIAMLRQHCPTVQFQAKPNEGIYPLMSILLPSGVEAATVAAELAMQNIETRRWYCPGLNRHPALSSAVTIGELPVSEDIGERILGLPFFIGMSDKQIVSVAEQLASALARHGGERA